MNETVLMAHGSGGLMMRDIIEQLFFESFGSATLKQAQDASVLQATCDKIAFSTDTFVVTPHFFPGGDIGHLAVCGTVNDVATSGAVPKYISCAFVLEEGFSLKQLRRICSSMAQTAREAGVEIVTGDTKVVERGQADGIYINTAGIGIMEQDWHLSADALQPGDKIIVSGTLGDHGITILSQREGLHFITELQSDATPLNHLIADVLAVCPRGTVHAFRDPTRGGLASTLNEFAESSKVHIRVFEDAVPVRKQVKGACEMLGLDVLQLANEGKMVCACAANVAEQVLSAMHANRYGTDAAIIGEVCKGEGKVSVQTPFGSERILDMLVGEQLPRIC